jgi:hypothetical protein
MALADQKRSANLQFRLAYTEGDEELDELCDALARRYGGPFLNHPYVAMLLDEHAAVLVLLAELRARRAAETEREAQRQLSPPVFLCQRCDQTPDRGHAPDCLSDAEAAEWTRRVMSRTLETFQSGYKKGAEDCAGSVAKMDALEKERDSLKAQLAARPLPPPPGQEG